MPILKSASYGFIVYIFCGVSLAASLDVTVTDAQGRPLANSIVVLRGENLPPIDTSITEVNQIANQFDPHVTIIRQHSAVIFPNLDQTRHQVYSFSSVKRFVTNLFAGREADPVNFESVGIVPVGCNIHDRMHAYIYVTDAPQFAISDIDGIARFNDLAVGDYQVEMLHPWQLSPGSVTRDIRVRRAGRDLSISESVGTIGPDPRTPRRPVNNPLIRGNPFAR
ncbi:MAG: hypothetical protein KAG82_09670 [Alcanivoracaceae bacterium]|nr:hypothetical protein [Alcanivoracaceae bacterium]